MQESTATGFMLTSGLPLWQEEDSAWNLASHKVALARDCGQELRGYARCDTLAENRRVLQAACRNILGGTQADSMPSKATRASSKGNVKLTVQSTRHTRKQNTVDQNQQTADGKNVDTETRGHDIF